MGAALIFPLLIMNTSTQRHPDPHPTFTQTPRSAVSYFWASRTDKHADKVTPNQFPPSPPPPHPHLPPYPLPDRTLWLILCTLTYSRHQTLRTMGPNPVWAATQLDTICHLNCLINAQWLGKEGSWICLLYTSPSPRDRHASRMPSSA